MSLIISVIDSACDLQVCNGQEAERLGLILNIQLHTVNSEASKADKNVPVSAEARTPDQPNFLSFFPGSHWNFPPIGRLLT